jgi:hypothetical protein
LTEPSAHSPADKKSALNGRIFAVWEVISARIKKIQGRESRCYGEGGGPRPGDLRNDFSPPPLGWMTRKHQPDKRTEVLSPVLVSFTMETQIRCNQE